MRILNLGIRPKNGTFHYPVIKTECIGDIRGALKLWEQFTHLIFTSQTAVLYWPGPWDKKTIAIGPKTAKALEKKGCTPLIAPIATQEGIISLLEKTPGHFFWPKSKRARPVLTDYMRQNGIPFFALDLYDTIGQKLQPVPNLDDFDAIFFTSPSTVEGFCHIFGKKPQGKCFIPIGPVTARALKKYLL